MYNTLLFPSTKPQNTAYIQTPHGSLALGRLHATQGLPHQCTPGTPRHGISGAYAHPDHLCK